MIRPRAILADDHAPLLEAASALLRPYCDIVGIVTDGEMLVEEAMRLRPDVIVADIAMPVMTGIGAIRRLHELEFSPAVVFLTIHAEPEFLDACIAEGALGFVLKSRMKSHLIPAIEAALAGQSYISPDV